MFSVSQLQVNGKSYNQAQLRLGPLGALHPVNHLGACVTGRQHRDQIVGDLTKVCPPKAILQPSSITEGADVLKKSVSTRPPVANAPEPNAVSKNKSANGSPVNPNSNLMGKSCFI